MTNDESRLRLADYLSHMLEAARLAREYVENTVKADLLNDRCTQQAVVLNLITIGEAASRTMNGLTVTEQDSSPRRASRSEALTSIRARREVTRTFCVIARVFAVDRGEPARHTDP